MTCLSGLSCLKCGLSPVTISQSTTPRLQMSAFSLHSCPASTCSRRHSASDAWQLTAMAEEGQSI